MTNELERGAIRQHVFAAVEDLCMSSGGLAERLAHGIGRVVILNSARIPTGMKEDIQWINEQIKRFDDPEPRVGTIRRWVDSLDHAEVEDLARRLLRMWGEATVVYRGGDYVRSFGIEH